MTNEKVLIKLKQEALEANTAYNKRLSEALKTLPEPNTKWILVLGELNDPIEITVGTLASCLENAVTYNSPISYFGTFKEQGVLLSELLTLAATANMKANELASMEEVVARSGSYQAPLDPEVRHRLYLELKQEFET